MEGNQGAFKINKNNLKKRGAQSRGLTFLSLAYRSSGVSSPLVSALTFGPSLIPEQHTAHVTIHPHNGDTRPSTSLAIVT